MSTLIKSGTIIDGTGAARYEGDLLIDEGRITAIGERLTGGDRVIDAGGLCVSPGIIDPHTHMDGQLLFEPKGSSSSWHGVTTVMMGLCGYSMAPVKPEDRDYIIRMFGRVEEMPLDLFRNEIAWDWVTFPEYLASLDNGLGVNAVTMVGHSTMRYYVMGPEALERTATPEEVMKLKGVLKDGLDAGAFGFTTSLAPSHFDMEARPVPSRQAAREELLELAGVLRDLGSTSMGLIPSGLFRGMTPEDKDLIMAMAATSGKPIQLNGFGGGDAWEWMGAASAKGAAIWGVTGSQPFYKFVSFHDTTTHFNSMDTWMKIMDLPVQERLKGFGDPSLRQTLRDEVDAEATMDGLKMRRPRINWDLVTVKKADKADNSPFEGMSIPQIAEKQGKHLADALLDLVVSEDLKTTLETRLQPESDWFDEEKARTYSIPHAVPMVSDAGAHLGAECKAGEGTYFLRRWVLDRGAMSLEEGIRKITSLPARYLGIRDRGTLRVGAAADVMVFDADRIDAHDKELLYDFPGGLKRWVQKADGVQFVLVNGEPTIWEGKEAGNLPGKVLRSGQYR